MSVVEVATDARLPIEIEPRYRKLQPRWCGLTKAQVAADQRRRLHEAMVEIAASRGYPAATIKSVSAVAGVSRQTFYDLFGAGPLHPREACFLGAYDYVVGRAVGRIKQAYRGEKDPERGLCRAFEQFAFEAASEPQAARFVLLETLGAGPAALDRMELGRRVFEQMIAASVGNPSDVALSPTIAKGIVGGVERIARLQLLAGRIDRLPATADQLSAWVSSYRPWRRFTPAEAPASSGRPQARQLGTDEGLRILRAAAAIAARDGYSTLTAARIARLAGVSGETFARLHAGPDAIEACFLAAVDLLGAEALVCAARASGGGGGWPAGVRSGIAALMDHVAGHPSLGRVAFIEIFAVGPSAIERRSALLGRFAEVLVSGIPDSQRPSELVAEAIVGGIWAVIHHCVVQGQVHRLRELADDAAYLALAPIVGHEAAVQLVSGSPVLSSKRFTRSED